MIEQTYAGAAGLNFFEEDALARRILEARLPPRERGAALDRLAAFGELCGGRLNALIEAAHQEGRHPRLVQFDRWGRRVDEIVYCAEQLEARRVALSRGILPPRPLLERMTMAYLLNQNGEGGVACPLAMTDGLVGLLNLHGTPAQRRRWLPVLNDPDGPTPLTGGQFVTELQGGSNVSENETRAARAADGTWRLTGLKWFCSNPGELWVTTAKLEGSGSVALFLMPRRLPDGGLNRCRILRLKDLSGTRGKATAEVEYLGATAELIGRPSQGLALLLRTVLRTSRIHVAAGSLGMMRRAFLEARLFARDRIVLGKPASALPSIARALDRMERVQTAATLAFYEELDLIEKGNPAADVLIPVLKIEISKAASAQVREARLILAGNGAIRDFSILPRLAEDALIQEIWEGTHPILAGHALKALRRPASRAAFEALLNDRSRRLLKDLDPSEPLEACDLAYRALVESLLAREK